MNKKIKKLWINALRSGKYKQGTGQLKLGDQFCCLGVLCDLHRKACRNKKYHWAKYDQYLKNNTSLPKEVMKWAGLPTRSVQIGQNTAIQLNDELELAFSSIAKLIDKEL